MTEIVVGARLDLKTNTLLPAVEATQAQFAKLEETAKKADAAVDKVVGKSAGAKPPIDLFGEGKSGDSMAAEIAKVEAALAKYLARLDPVGRATKTQVEGQALLSHALELGIVNQEQYARGVALVTQAYERQKLTAENLVRGKLTLAETVKLAGRELGTMAGALAGSVAAMAAGAIGAAALTAATALLALGTDELVAAEERLQKVLKENSHEIEKEKLSAATRLANARAATEAKRQEAAAILLKVEAMREEAIAHATLQAGMAAGNITPEIAADIAKAAGAPFDAAIARMRAAMAIDYYTRFPYDDALIRGRRRDENTRDADAETLRRRPRAARSGPSAGERELLRQAEAAIKAKRALDEYAEASQDIIEKAEAELSGRRELIAQIELEAQLRKRYGVEFVEQNRERIAALAQERAAAQRVADQYKATAQFFENSAGQIGNVIEATLVLSWDRSEDAIKSWENTLLSSLRQVQAELTRLAIVNPLINAMTGNSKLPTAYGQGGIVDVVLGLLGLGGAGANDRIEAGIRHDGGRVGAAGPTRIVRREIFAAAPRAHDGLYLAPGERPVIARDEETIFTPRQLENAGGMMRALTALASQRVAGGEAPVINIIDQRGQGGAPIETRRRRGAGGRLEIDVIVKDAVKRALGDGSMDRTMEANYGIPRRGVRGGGV